LGRGKKGGTENKLELMHETDNKKQENVLQTHEVVKKLGAS
jgi:hypothetical protein